MTDDHLTREEIEAIYDQFDKEQRELFVVEDPSPERLADEYDEFVRVEIQARCHGQLASATQDLETERQIIEALLLLPPTECTSIHQHLSASDFVDEFFAWVYFLIREAHYAKLDVLSHIFGHRPKLKVHGAENLAFSLAEVFCTRDGKSRDFSIWDLNHYIRRLKELSERRKRIGELETELTELYE